MSVIASSVNSSSMSNPKFPIMDEQVSEALSFVVPQFKKILEKGMNIVEEKLTENDVSEEELNKLRTLFKEVTSSKQE